MDTISIKVDLPKDILSAANIPEAKASADIKMYLALYMFKERILSFGKAAELSGMEKLDFMELTRKMHIPLNYDEDDYYEDMKTIRGLEL